MYGTHSRFPGSGLAMALPLLEAGAGRRSGGRSGPVTMGGQGKGAGRGPIRCTPLVAAPVGVRGRRSPQGGAILS